MAIREVVAGFEVLDENDTVVAKVRSFAEAIELNALVKPKQWVEPVMPPRAKISQKSTCSAICSKRPHRSRSIAVNPHQVPEFNNQLKEHGIRGAYYDGSGELVSTSKSGRRQAVRLRDFHDADGGYSDP